MFLVWLLVILVILFFLLRKRPRAKGFKIIQVGDNMPILGILAGGPAGSFVAAVVPSNGALQANSVPVYSVDNSAVVLTVNPSDASGLSVSVLVPASVTAVSFNLTLSGINSAGVAISETINVPVNQPAPPPPPPATGFVINQVS